MLSAAAVRRSWPPRNARPVGGTQKKGADRGIDGVISFSTGLPGEVGRALVSVKSGAVNAGMVRDLEGVLEREKAGIGLFITLEEPTGPMRQEAATAGVCHSALSGRDYPRIQLLTIRELLEEHRRPDLPLLVLPAYRQAERVEKKAAEFRVRYATFGFQPDANLDDGPMGPVAFALKELTADAEARIVELVKQAVS